MSQVVGVENGLRCAREMVSARGLLGGTCLIGVDGLGAAGKSTFAAQLASQIGAVVVSVDDLSQPGVSPWEIDRFVEQIWTPLSAGQPGRYQRWHWTASQPGPWIIVPVGVPVILEGIRSTDAADRAHFDLRIWLDAPEQLRAQRARLRDPARFACWSTNWMPKEQAWARQHNPAAKADLIVHIS